jgi:hypothetical protein
MWNLENEGSAEVWKAAQQRRTEDLARWFSATPKKIEEPTSIWRPLPWGAIRPALTAAVVAFIALASVSSVTHGKAHHFVPTASAPMPAVNIP